MAAQYQRWRHDGRGEALPCGLERSHQIVQSGRDGGRGEGGPSQVTTDCAAWCTQVLTLNDHLIILSDLSEYCSAQRD